MKRIDIEYMYKQLDKVDYEMDHTNQFQQAVFRFLQDLLWELDHASRGEDA